jgi:hypothetical protein
MANPNPAYVYELSVIAVAEKQQIANVMHYVVLNDTGVPPDSINMAQVSTAFRAVWSSNIMQRVSVAYQAHKYVCREYTFLVSSGKPPPAPAMKPLLGQVGETVPTVPDAGLRPGPYHPTYVAVTGQKLSGFGGRENRGSFRFGPIAEDDTDGNVIAESTRANWVNVLNGIKTFPVASGGQTMTMGMVIWQATRAGKGLSGTALNPGYVRPVSLLNVAGILGSQISRKETVKLGG